MPVKTPQHGNGKTVRQACAALGPSQRLTLVIGELGRSPSSPGKGQSGQMFSEHYLDQFPLWLEGRTLELPLSSKAVDVSKSHQLTRLPN